MKLSLLLLTLGPLVAQAPVHVDYTCTAEDVESFGLSCSEDRPCPIFFEVSAVEAFGSSIFVAGDIHTANATLYGVLMSTDDGGASWNESIARLRSSSFEQFQIIGNHGWLSGQRLEPLPKDPFFLITSDGGKSWHQKPLFEESRFGSILQFRFESASSGELIFDDTVGKAIHQESYASKTGGESWEIKQTSTKALHLDVPKETWTATAATGSPTFLIEHIVNGKKEVFARFLIHIGDCK